MSPSKYILPKNIVALARDAINDENVATRQREWRAFAREKHLAKRVLDDDKAKRKLRERVRALEEGLVRACDLAIDSADVIDSENIADPEESEDFRYSVGKIRTLVKRPEAARHVMRKLQEQEAAAQVTP
jgi:hypothetical protein